MAPCALNRGPQLGRIFFMFWQKNKKCIVAGPISRAKTRPGPHAHDFPVIHKVHADKKHICQTKANPRRRRSSKAVYLLLIVCPSNGQSFYGGQVLCRRFELELSSEHVPGLLTCVKMSTQTFARLRAFKVRASCVLQVRVLSTQFACYLVMSYVSCASWENTSVFRKKHN